MKLLCNSFRPHRSLTLKWERLQLKKILTKVCGYSICKYLWTYLATLIDFFSINRAMLKRFGKLPIFSHIQGWGMLINQLDLCFHYYWTDHSNFTGWLTIAIAPVPCFYSGTYPAVQINAHAVTSAPYPLIQCCRSTPLIRMALGK